MKGLPVTIRLLDPPLHEFIPHGEAEMQDVADAALAPCRLGHIEERRSARRAPEPVEVAVPLRHLRRPERAQRG